MKLHFLMPHMVLLIIIIHELFCIHISAETLVSSPQFSPITPLSSSMPRQVEEENHQKDYSHKKVLLVLVIIAIALSVLILSILCLWIYHIKHPSKSKRKNVLNSGILFNYYILFHL